MAYRKAKTILNRRVDKTGYANYDDVYSIINDNVDQISEFYELVVEEFDPDFAARWVADIILGELNYRDIDIGDVESRLDEFRRLIAYVAGGKITEKNARSIVLRRMLDEGSSPEEILDQEELEVSDDKEVRDFVLEVIEENKDAVADYERGESNAMNYLVGQVMVKTKGNANPAFINQILKEIIENGGGEKKELQ